MDLQLRLRLSLWNSTDVFADSLAIDETVIYRLTKLMLSYVRKMQHITVGFVETKGFYFGGILMLDRRYV